MFLCKWCRRGFSTTYGRTQHLRQARKCRRRYKQELAVIVSRTKSYHVDDPEELPSDMEGDRLEPVDEGLDDATEAVETGTGAGAGDDYPGIFRGMTLFEDYLAAVSAGPSAKSSAEVGEPMGEPNYQTDIPHAVPAFTIYHPNQNAGQPIRVEPEANPQQHVTGNLANDANFQMADFLVSTGMTSNERDTFFKLELNQHLPWANDDQFMEDINSLPPEPDMTPYMVTIGEGDDAQQVEMRCANIVEVLGRLVSDPQFKQHIEYVPHKHYTDESCKVRVHGEMTGGNWFWRTQCLIKDEFGTILPIILMSDKTSLTACSGGKKAWPVYITIGNISKDIRRQPSKHAVILLGYLPIPAGLSEDGDEVSQGEWAWEIFHTCMSKMVEPLVEASRNGVELWCSDGGVRRCYPFLAAYIADNPEQNLVTCTSGCPICEEPKEGRGDLGAPAPLRTRNSTLRALEEAEVGRKVGVNELGLRNIWPFWTNLPLTNISASITPDLLHQLHKGMFLDHLVKWCKQLMSADEMDRRFMAMTRYHGTRHFANGITGVSQWTGREAKEMARVFMSVIDGAVPPKAIRAARALINFMFLAHAPTLTGLELDEMDEWLAIFHANKGVFGKRPDGTDRDFDLIRKLHMLRHHTYSICELGTPDGTNTEMSESLHIPLAKNPYRASNKVEPMEQMTKYVQRNNAVARRRFYLQTNGRLHLKFAHSRVDKEGVDGGYSDDEGGTCKGDKSTRPDWGVPTKPFAPQPQFRMSKRSTWPHRAGSTLIDAHEAFHLIPAVNNFLDKIPLLHRPASMRPRILETHLFPSWSRCTLEYPRLPFKPSEPAKSVVVQAAPAMFKDGKQSQAACFDTVLVRCCPEKYGLTGYRPARVRAIFQLPLQARHIFPHTLVYVEFFTCFTRTRDSPSGFYRTSPSFRGASREVAVIPLDAICMPCHLVPRFGSLLPGVMLTNSTDSLDAFREFSFNPYADYFLFSVMHHWEKCLASK